MQQGSNLDYIFNSRILRKLDSLCQDYPKTSITLGLGIIIATNITAGFALTTLTLDRLTLSMIIALMIASNIMGCIPMIMGMGGPLQKQVMELKNAALFFCTRYSNPATETRSLPRLRENQVAPV